MSYELGIYRLVRFPLLAQEKDFVMESRLANLPMDEADVSFHSLFLCKNFWALNRHR